MYIIGASLSKPHIDGTTGRFHICIMVRPSPPFVVHSMNSTKDERLSSPLTSKLVVGEKEKASAQAQRDKKCERAHMHVYKMRMRNCSHEWFQFFYMVVRIGL